MTLFVFDLLNKRPFDANAAHTFGSIFSVHSGAFWVDFERDFQTPSELLIPDEVIKYVNENRLLKVPEFFYTHLKILITSNGLKKLLSIIKLNIEQKIFPVGSVSYLLRPFQKCVEYLKPDVLSDYGEFFVDVLDRLLAMDVDNVPIAEKKKPFRVYDVVETVLLRLWAAEVFISFFFFFLIWSGF
jgi:hypothetical protein